MPPLLTDGSHIIRLPREPAPTAPAHASAGGTKARSKRSTLASGDARSTQRRSPRRACPGPNGHPSLPLAQRDESDFLYLDVVELSGGPERKTAAKGPKTGLSSQLPGIRTPPKEPTADPRQQRAAIPLAEYRMNIEAGKRMQAPGNLGLPQWDPNATWRIQSSILAALARDRQPPINAQG